MGGAAEVGKPALPFWRSAAPPPWRRRRRCPRAAGSSPSCCLFLRLRRQPGVEWMQGRWWRRCEAAAAVVCGVLVEDLWRWPRIWGGRCSGCGPDLWSFIDPDPARRSWWLLWFVKATAVARSSSVPWRGLWASASFLVSGGGGRARWSCSWLKTARRCGAVLRILLFFFACIRPCTIPLV